MRIKFLCYTLELGPIDIVDLKQMWMMFVYASELDQLIDQYTGNFKHQTSKCLSRIHRLLDFIFIFFCHMPHVNNLEVNKFVF